MLICFPVTIQMPQTSVPITNAPPEQRPEVLANQALEEVPATVQAEIAENANLGAPES